MFEKRARSIVKNKTLLLKKINKVNPGNCLFNYKCHMNTVDIAIKNKHSKIALVMYRLNGDIDFAIHFINVNNEGTFTDNTIGVFANKTEYRFVKYIYEDDFYNIENIFGNYRAQLNKELPWYVIGEILF